jgi:hypothetical protein
LSFRLDNCNLDMHTEIGDGHVGASVTFGKIIAERSTDAARAAPDPGKICNTNIRLP